MTFAIKIGITLACLLFIYIQTRYQAKRFKQQKTIEHWGKATLYGLFVALLTAVMMWGHWHEWRTYDVWKDIPIIGLVTRLAWFDLILSILRHKPLFYNGDIHAALKGESLQDWIENNFSPDIVRMLKIIYIILFITLLIVL